MPQNQRMPISPFNELTGMNLVILQGTVQWLMRHSELGDRARFNLQIRDLAGRRSVVNVVLHERLVKKLEGARLDGAFVSVRGSLSTRIERGQKKFEIIATDLEVLYEP